MANTSNITSALEPVNFSTLLGAPLSACVDAQAQAASATTDYIERVGFTFDRETGKYKAVTISFRYSSSEGEKRITLPLLSVVPVPYLQIHNVDLQFAADLSLENNTLIGVVSDKLAGNSSSQNKPNASSAISSDLKVNVNIKASSADMPLGISKLLEIMQKNIRVTNN